MATAFTVGVAQDSDRGRATGSLLRAHVGHAIVALNYQRIRQFDLLQQSLAILVLMLLSAGIEQWLRNGIDVPAVPWAEWLA